MIEELFEVYDVDTKQVYASNMNLDNAMLFLGAFFEKHYRDIYLKLGIQRTKETIEQLGGEE